MNMYIMEAEQLLAILIKMGYKAKGSAAGTKGTTTGTKSTGTQPKSTEGGDAKPEGGK